MISELAKAMQACRTAFIGIGLMTGVINILYLTGSIFMLEVYDRVLPSRSIPTLVGIAILAAMLYGFQVALDIVRLRILSRIGLALDEGIGGRVYSAVVRAPLRMVPSGDGLQPIRDLDQLRGFLSGLGPTALFDMPWMPLYLIVCFLFHPLIGLTALIGCVVLVAFTALTEATTKKPVRQAMIEMTARNALSEVGRRNAEVLSAMAMTERLGENWAAANRRFTREQQRAADIGNGLGALSKGLRLALQSAVLGVGAFLVIRGEASPGIMIAASILSARALAPVELAIAHWKGFVAARQGWKRLGELLKAFPVAGAPIALPRPHRSLAVEDISVTPPGQRRLVVQEIGFTLEAGQCLGVVGPSGSGKSSLIRALVGVWQPARGKVRLDGAAFEQWRPDDLGAAIGYLPQDVELFAGTVAQNISRFHPAPDPAEIIAAAEAAGVHQLILRLPEGYETPIGDGGAALSAGQRQRVALARALFGSPFLVVLDEPNSNLDADGEAALNQAISGVRARGGIVVIVAHRHSALASIDRLLVLQEGRSRAFGPKEQVLRKLAQQPAPPVPAGGAEVVAMNGRNEKPATARMPPDAPMAERPLAGKEGLLP
ncbi:type I secretion system permease/ATPase [Ancylobacter defluvii]|uniref:Type I secretion protein n=1 Tax=Ancylobacter defluvii TaxID=1282440 RepID=A0A9W6K094_9HYPH|nr:type I secretion system permease/ATPase [Ancylobacter defluvii]MBS7589557.1 type I secretion system permease/ATPase [Ancylobacter defluvii]GLK85174.1 type I secretion protein [Ancylobacter defluvii]